MDEQDKCDRFYDMDNVVTIAITMEGSAWDALRNAEPHGGRCNFEFTGDRYDWFRATTVAVSGSSFPVGGSYGFASVGIKKRSFCGSFSRNKPALALNFSKFNASNEDAIEALIGTHHITLNNCKQDPSFIRQPLGYEMFRQAGLPYSRCNFAFVRVNGSPIGFYVNIEPIKKRYVQHNFNNDAGNLYELDRGEDFIQNITDTDRISFEGFSSFADRKDLKLAAATLATSGASGIASVIQTSQFLQYFAMEALLKHWDGYTDHLNNTYVYNDVVAVANPTPANVNFKFVPWGLDQILQQDKKFQLDDESVPGRLVLEDSELLKRLKTEIRTDANSIFDCDNYFDVLIPFIAKMESVLLAAGQVDALSHVDAVRKQLKLVKSGAYQLLGEPAVVDCLKQIEGKLSLLRAHDVGTKFGPPQDEIDVEVVVRLDTQPDKAFGFQLRADRNEFARYSMLDVLRAAFTEDRRVRIEYRRTGVNNGVLIRVAELS